MVMAITFVKGENWRLNRWCKELHCTSVPTDPSEWLDAWQHCSRPRGHL